jgi:hypothetical protein
MLLSRSEPGTLTPPQSGPVFVRRPNERLPGCECGNRRCRPRQIAGPGAAPRTTDVRGTRQAMTICVDSICAVRGLPIAGRL